MLGGGQVIAEEIQRPAGAALGESQIPGVAVLGDQLLGLAVEAEGPGIVTERQVDRSQGRQRGA